jgi:hypothetical protein
VFDSIEEEATFWLERLFEESSVLQVMKGIMIGDKAPDLDSFTIAFFLT